MNKIMQGTWGEQLDTAWEFFVAASLPEDISVSAVMGIPFWEGKIALVHTKRGWEIPGGHVESGEDISTCLERELIEEVGAHNILAKKLFGYRKITNPDRKINASGGRGYPKYTLVPYYLVELGAEPLGGNGEDRYSSGLFSVTGATVENSHDREIIRIGTSLQVYIACVS